MKSAVPLSAVCSAPDCDKPRLARGVCGMHWWRLRKHGSLDLPPRQARPTSERFWPRLRLDGNDCWLWTGAQHPAGYGVIMHEGRHVGTHRLAYELMVGEIPAGLHLDHLCRTPACCNPAHLDPVPCKVNVQRGDSPSAVAARTNCCFRGHDLTKPENCYMRRASGHRTCRVCARAADRRRAPRRRTPGGSQ